jgi:F0F1-type ATP synthase assembly protein I
MQGKPRKKKRLLNRYLVLTSVPFQIGITIYLGTYLGETLDSKYTFEKPWFTILGVLLALIVAMYSVIQQLNRLNKQDDE